ncbi:MAG: diaminopimelate epimerase [Phycisphaerae bacterium]|nr:MAG: diaminopimelate epimerase [Phycisphaerae bacterium]
MRFTKMHGIGNDYVYVNGFTETIENPSELARKVSDRHFGIGSDGLILILPSEHADVRMRMFNADGSESEMCGNGIRCVAKYAYDHGLSRNNPMTVETGRGVLRLSLDVENGKVQTVTVDMGEPILDLEQIPVTQGATGRNALLKRQSDHVYALATEMDGKEIQATFVSMGNPHATIYVPDVSEVDLNLWGPKLEHYPAFPRRMNVHFVQVVSRDEVIMRTWERGKRHYTCLRDRRLCGSRFRGADRKNEPKAPSPPARGGSASGVVDRRQPCLHDRAGYRSVFRRVERVKFPAN